MLRLIASRILATIPVMGIVALIVFTMLRLSGDPAAILAGDTASSEQVERIRQALGLNLPVWQQFVTWIGQLLRFDLGTSLFTGLPVTTLIAQRIEPTLMLALTTTIVFSVLVAVPLGVLAAWRAGGWTDRFVMVLSVLGFSVPVFVMGYVLIFNFAITLRWFPVQGYTSPFVDFGRFLTQITLPTLTLSFIYIALIARITRASVMEVLGEDYIRTARAKGQVERKVLFRHALKNAAVPIVTVIGLGVALLIGGVVVTRASTTSRARPSRRGRDHAARLPIIQGLILFFALVYIVLNLIIDIIYTIVDPRIRY